MWMEEGGNSVKEHGPETHVHSSHFWGLPSQRATRAEFAKPQIYSLTAQGSRRLKTRCPQGSNTSRSCRGGSFLAFSSFWWLQAFFGIAGESLWNGMQPVRGSAL